MMTPQMFGPPNPPRVPLINNGQAPGGPGPLRIYLVPRGPINIGPRFDLNFYENQLTRGYI